jgi:YggT family protein
MDFMSSSGITVVSTLGGIYLLMLLLRFLLQIARADFYNPLSQAIVRFTDPVVRPLRALIPGYRGIDFATLVAALLVQVAAIYGLIALYGATSPPLSSLITWAFVGNLLFVINIYYYAIIGSIIMSFIMMFSGNPTPQPMLQLVWQLTEPVMGPIRSIVPPMGGLDFSPIVIFLGIQLLQKFIYTTFGITTGMAAVILGI